MRRVEEPDDNAGAPAAAPSAIVDMDRLHSVIAEARAAAKSLQAEDGHWVFELEADATIPSEYILLMHYLDEVDDEVETRLSDYLRKNQASHGGWPLFYGGDFDLSASVKAYFALKLAGDDPEAPHMAAARIAIRRAGGAAACNVFTRISLALFGQVPWRAVPVMPVEIMLLPRWFPFHLTKISYWSRTVLVPLLILMALKPRARNPRNVDIGELFLHPPEETKNYLKNPTGSAWGEIFLALDKALRMAEGVFPKNARQRSIDAAIAFVTARLNGEDGLGGIFPAMANAVMAFDALGYAKDHPDVVTAKSALRKLLVLNGDSGYCQPCLSPVWDTSLMLFSLMEAGEPREGVCVRRAADWLKGRQVLDVKGDWADRRPDLRPGGWAFQYWNSHYPDVDDTAVVAMALDRIGDPAYGEAVERAREWIIGMQSANGGWGSFDADNTNTYLNHIPFADHGALLDPPTEDVSARCVSLLAQLGLDRSHPAVARGIAYLRSTQQPDGSWFGRWGTNYIYGTWSVLSALNAVGEDMSAAYVREAVAWLEGRQRPDGGWGEDGATYWDERRTEAKASTPSQTAWALLGLMAAGEVESDAVARGIAYLMASERNGSTWEEPWYTAVGFPKVFYLRYHGYSAYFPLWALARYRNLRAGNALTPQHGM